jgi:hypothetical protein
VSVVGSRGGDGEGMNRLVGGSLGQTAGGADLEVVVARCLVTLRLVYGMEKVSNVWRLCQRKLRLMDGSRWVWSWIALRSSRQQPLRWSHCGGFDDESEWCDV